MVFRHLLVPLDGSHLAESALPVAEVLATRLPARVTLFHAVEQNPPATVHGERHLSAQSEAEVYLAAAAAWLAQRGVTAEVVVRKEGTDVAATIATVAADVGADLVVLCTHGRGGLRALLFGRVAQKVLQHGTIPVFLIKPGEGDRDRPVTLRRLLVPLDGSDTAETALPAASGMGGAFGAEIMLMWVVPTVGTISGERAAVTRLMPTAAAALLDAEAAQAVAYLEEVAARLRAEGRNVTPLVERGEPVRVLVDEAARRDADLIVIATHGRSGVGAVWAGSVASRIVAQATRPVLLIRIPRTL